VSGQKQRRKMRLESSEDFDTDINWCEFKRNQNIRRATH